MKDDDNCGFGEERNAFGLACEKFYSNFEGSIGICGSISKNREDKLEKEEGIPVESFPFPFSFFFPLILLLLQGWVISHPTHQRNRRSPYSSFLNPKIVTHGRIEFTDVQKEGVETGEEKKCLEFWGVILKNKGSNSFLFLFSPFCC